ncbi:MAG TPA: hypothetical protein VGC65_11160 [Bacteroidia bacterium]|jgi:antitoxin component YwqK of YwqJK toxin-antitoxin module
MKKLLIVFILFSLFACNKGINDPEKRNENWSWWVDAKTGEGEWVPVADTTTVKSGTYTLFFSNGKIREKGTLLNGILIDTVYTYDIDEKLIKYGLIKPDTVSDYFIHEGAYRDYFPTGELKEEGVVKNHQRGQTWTRFYKNGKKEWIEKLIDRTGWTVSYYDNGQVSDSSYHIKGLGNGRAAHWYRNGQMREVGYWKDGLEHGETKIYYENGQLELIQNSVNGKLEGKREGWFESGQKKYLKWMKDGLAEGELITWYGSGKIKHKGSYKEDKEVGVHLLYHENGQLRTRGMFENGKQVGVFTWFDDNGKLVQKDTYESGVLKNVEKFKPSL